MTSAEQQPSGVDMARVALQAARKAAKGRSSVAPRGPKRRRSVARPDGRDPLQAGTAIGGLMNAYGWEAPAAAGSIINHWPQIAPELAGKVQPVHYDPERNQLDLLPSSPAYATQMRLLQRQVIARINDHIGPGTVEELRVLPPHAGGGRSSVPLRPAGTQRATAVPPEPAPLHTAETASAGYHRAIAAHRQATPTRQADPAIAQAAERQARAMRALSEHAFPETPPTADDAPTTPAGAHANRRARADTTHNAALRRARTERAQSPKSESTRA